MTNDNGGNNVEISGEKVWSSEGYFKNQLTDYNIEKVNYPEILITYVNQAYLTMQSGKKCTMTIISWLGKVLKRQIHLKTLIPMFVKKMN